MAGGVELATAYVSLVVEGSKIAPGVKQAFGSVESEAGRSGTRAGKRMSLGLGGALKRAAAGFAAYFAVDKIKDGLVEVVSEASNLGESLNAVNVTFGKNAEGIRRLGEEAANALGLSNTEFNGLAVRFSSFAGTIAGKGGSVVRTMDEMTTRAADFASVMNLDVNEAAEMFQSGLAGETEPLRKYGLDLSAAAVSAHAYAEGIAETGDKLTENQKVQARYSLLMEQTAKTQGDFANTSDSLANSQRRLGAQFDNIQAQIGQALLPIMEDITNWVADKALPAFTGFIEQMQSGQGAGGRFAEILSGLREVLGNVGTFIMERVVPALAAYYGWVGENILPAMRDFANKVLPAAREAIGNLGTKIEENRPFLERMGTAIRKIAEFIFNEVVPAYAAWVSFWLPKLGKALGVVIDVARESAQALLRLVSVGARAFRLLMQAAVITFGNILKAADNGLSWIPGVGPKIARANRAFQEFANKAIDDLDRVARRADEMGRAIDRNTKPRTVDITIRTHHAGGRNDPLGELPGRAVGGPVMPNQPYIVGERGPEVFMARQAGHIRPNHELAEALGGGGDMNFNGPIYTTDVNAAARAISREHRKALTLAAL